MDGCSKRRGGSRACVIRTSSRCMAPSSTTAASACGWSSCAASRSSRPSRLAASFGAREAALIGLDLCAALAAVHGAGLLHRDVKAQNVMRESGGRLVLMDFGTGEELSGTNRLVGTPLYLAPEIFRGQRASVQSDLYSVGVLLFYLVTGKFPVNAGSMEQLARAHAHRERQPLRDLRPDLPEVFIAAVERALDSDPSRRYQSVGELESALRESLDAPAARPAVPSPVAARRRQFGLRVHGRRGRAGRAHRRADRVDRSSQRLDRVDSVAWPSCRSPIPRERSSPK